MSSPREPNADDFLRSQLGNLAEMNDSAARKEFRAKVTFWVATALAVLMLLVVGASMLVDMLALQILCGAVALGVVGFDVADYLGYVTFV